jgi:hypothetical protein
MDIDAIRSVQFVQEALESVEIRIIAPNGLTASDEYRAGAELRQHLGEAIEIRLRVVQSIERNSNSGKFREVGFAYTTAFERQIPTGCDF